MLVNVSGPVLSGVCFTHRHPRRPRSLCLQAFTRLCSSTVLGLWLHGEESFTEIKSSLFIREMYFTMKIRSPLNRQYIYRELFILVKQCNVAWSYNWVDFLPSLVLRTLGEGEGRMGGGRRRRSGEGMCPDTTSFFRISLIGGYSQVWSSFQIFHHWKQFFFRTNPNADKVLKLGWADSEVYTWLTIILVYIERQKLLPLLYNEAYQFIGQV